MLQFPSYQQNLSTPGPWNSSQHSVWSESSSAILIGVCWYLMTPHLHFLSGYWSGTSFHVLISPVDHLQWSTPRVFYLFSNGIVWVGCVVDFFFFFLTVLGVWILCLLGRHSSAWAKPPALFALVIFGDRVLLFDEVGLDCYPAALGWQQLLVEMGLVNFFCPGWSSWSLPPK
jgi:hypothetical protein